VKTKKKGPKKILTFALPALCLVLVIGGAFLLHQLKGKKRITTQDIRSGEKIIGLRFTEKERHMMRQDVKGTLSKYNEIRKTPLDNHIPPSLYFNPAAGIRGPAGGHKSFVFIPDPDIEIPENMDDLAFYPVTALASLIKNRKITSLELTRFFLERLKKYGPALKCVVSLTEDLALAQAKRADEEIERGIYRGPLHGIPWGAKDLLAVKNTRTTWGAMPYKDQIIDIDATVVQRLEDAGAVLVAKLSLGALAMGDVWFDGKTKSPWNTVRGSSGSSAGPGAATAAGLVAFSIGSETWGSIVSPSTRCYVSGLRPTFGRVSRYGAMALSWSMDKIGPMCRSVEDCALVFQAIYGPDGKDLSLVNIPFNWNPNRDLREIRIGYLKSAFEKGRRNKKNNLKVLEVLRSLGVELIPFELPDIPVYPMSIILDAEAAAAFDDLTRSNQDDLLVRQDKGAWPNAFRQARFIPAVEYIQANRLRTLYIQRMAEKMQDIDVYVAPPFGDNLLATNLTGHPAVVVPNVKPSEGETSSITFIGNLFDEASALRVALAYQQATGFHLVHPNLEETLAGKKKADK
jgi:Asp-tRNA(Asn)/Glu-tRNA(Gln) amidotransferase A subunit family amidase